MVGKTRIKEECTSYPCSYWHLHDDRRWDSHSSYFWYIGLLHLKMHMHKSVS
uniref:Uncharacterized protein n=1 Tax=Rhizophora mucronata TaxID=61149 RepID=A0A2P2MB66_RHIMU